MDQVFTGAFATFTHNPKLKLALMGTLDLGCHQISGEE